MDRYQWSHLNTQQVGAYCEYFVKMELTMYGFEVYTTEVDDRGLDFVARRPGKPFLEIQVKSLRSHGYVFMPKSKFSPHENLYLALGLLFESQPPRLYLIPSTVWKQPNTTFVERNYEAPGLKSKPEWGINVSQRNIAEIEAFAFRSVVEQLCA